MNDKKTVWSLQKNKRTESERNIFEPTGKPLKQKQHLPYILAVILVFFVVSFILTYFSETTLEACLTDTFCINSKNNLIMYSLFVFLNFVIVIGSIFVAYIFGKNLANLIKPAKKT